MTSWAKSALGSTLTHTLAANLPGDHWGQADVWIPATTFTACDDGDLFGVSANLINFTNDAIFAVNTTGLPTPTWRWETNPGIHASTGPAPATTYTIEYHYHDAGQVDWYVNGVLVLTDTGRGGSTSNRWILGGGVGCCCEVYYFTNVKISTTRGTGDIFADDFSGGLGNWSVADDVPGSVTIVAATSSAPCPTVTLNPIRGQAGTLVTVTGSGFAPDAPLSIVFRKLSIGAFTATSDGSGDFTATLTVPEGIGATPVSVNVYVADDEADVACTQFFICGTMPADGITTAPDPLIATGGVTNGANEILDYIFHDGAHWVLWQDPSVLGSNLTTFPPPANHTMNATRISADGSSVVDYPIDTNYQWIFGGGSIDDAGLLSSRFCGFTPVSAPVWSQKSFFASWDKPILDAHFASDGSSLWVGILTRETIPYPWLDNTDACGTNPGSANQFVPLSVLTSGFTSFATSTGSGYQRFSTQTAGPIDQYEAHAFPVTDAGEEDMGYWSPPIVAVFSFDGAAFVRIGDIEAKYAPGITNGVKYGTWDSLLGSPLLTQKAPRGTLISRISMCASPTNPGVCHVVWSEGGDWGRQGLAAGDCSRLVWDAGPLNRSYRINYTRWSPTAKVLDNDLFASRVDRTAWWFPNDNGNPPAGVFETGYTWPDQGNFGATCIHDIRNDNPAGTPYLFLSWQQSIARCWDGGTDGVVPDFYFPPSPNDSHGNPWLDNNILWCDTLHVYDLDSGAPTLMQSIGAPHLPSEAETEHFWPPASPLTAPFASDSLYGAPKILANPGIAISSYGPQDKAFGVSLPYDDPELGVPCYLIHVPWTRRWIGSVAAPDFVTGGARVAMRGFYRVPCDMASGFDFLDGDRQLQFTLLKEPFSGSFLDTFGSADFFSDPRNVWIPSPYSSLGIGFGLNGYPGLWFDRVCSNVWQELDAAWTPTVANYSLGAQCPGFHYDPDSDSITIVTAASLAEPDAGPLFAVVTEFICRGCRTCPCGTGIHIAHRF